MTKLFAQFKVKTAQKKDEVICCDTQTGETLRPIQSRKAFDGGPNGIWKYRFCKEDLLPGDIVEIVGDYAVKVSDGQKTIQPVPYAFSAGYAAQPSAWAQSIQENTTPSSASEAIASSSSQQTNICKCPFGPNLGPIMHVSSCKEFKS